MELKQMAPYGLGAETIWTIGRWNTNKSIPTQIGTASNWISVSCGNNHTMAMKSDGTAWAWGFNGIGELGDGTTTQIQSYSDRHCDELDWPACWRNHSLGFKSERTSFCATGLNFYGQLGNGITDDRSNFNCVFILFFPTHQQL
ncbi:MAG: hypothetical protein IPK03_14410 [Bacteroidetes bacterium]|nr:hypothetical protein [Bacteroidota bacterium]